ncbi:MAG: hypothetical protein ACF8GE_08880 [Phycisphaerales bacterium JB043]
MSDFDKHTLYERAVQDPEMTARFLDALIDGHTESRVLGEDFAGTGAVSRAWVALHEHASAVCVDHDEEPLERLRNTQSVDVVHCDVMGCDIPVDVLAVLNFSICEWHTRGDLVRYLTHAHGRLRPGGALVLDLYGGRNAMSVGSYEVEFERKGAMVEHRALRYRWEQQHADTITGRVRNAMHFQLADGTWANNAFVYEWRLWSIAEMRDALLEASFRSIDVHDSLGDALENDGTLHPRAMTSDDELDDDYVVYIVARDDAGSRR